MSRYAYLRNRHLDQMTLHQLRTDVAYCRHREEIASTKSAKKTWRERREEAEAELETRKGAIDGGA